MVYLFEANGWWMMVVKKCKKHLAANRKYAKKCSNYMRKQIHDRYLTLGEIVAKLDKLGFEYEPVNISAINGRGTYSLVYFIAMCQAMGIKEINIKDILEG
jgi:hypothetical protein